MSHLKTIGYILLVDPSQVDLRDIVRPLPGYKFPDAIRIVRTRSAAAGMLSPPLQLIGFHGYGLSKNFNNAKELLEELNKNQARKEDLPCVDNEDKKPN